MCAFSFRLYPDGGGGGAAPPRFDPPNKLLRKLADFVRPVFVSGTACGTMPEDDAAGRATTGGPSLTQPPESSSSESLQWDQRLTYFHHVFPV